MADFRVQQNQQIALVMLNDFFKAANIRKVEAVNLDDLVLDTQLKHPVSTGWIQKTAALLAKKHGVVLLSAEDFEALKHLNDNLNKGGAASE